MTKNNTPALRFDGFNGEWVLKTVSEISAQIRRVNPASQAPVKMISAASGFINQSEKYSSDNAGQSLKKYVELYKGELAYNHGASKLRPFGSCFELKEDFARVPFVYHCFRVLNENSTFTALSLNRDAIQVQLQRLISSGARMDGLLNISFDQYGTVSSYFPSPEEQRAIGELFSDLDTLIEQHRAKRANLQQTKTALLQRMFPQDGADEPELQLGGFSGAWETVSFDSLLTRVEIGTNILGSNRYHGVPLLKMGNIQRGYFDFTSFERLPDSSELPSVSLVRTGDFLFNARNTMELVGKGATWMGESGAFAFNGNIARFTLERVDTKFFNYLYNHPRSIRDVSKCATGTTSVAAIYPRSLKSVQFQIPPLDEQRAIGEVFTNLDALIAAEHRYITQLAQAKTALLQRMFV